MTKRLCVAFASLLGAACRLGGPEGSPTDLIAIDGASPPDERDARDQPAEADPGAPADPAAIDAQSAPVDAAVPAAPDATSATCEAPVGLECDPVSGEGCLPLMQCVVDPSSNQPAAYCIFSSILLDVTCAQDELSTDCPPQTTCIMGVCREYCYCDADCDDGSACTEASGEGGSGVFKLCAHAGP
jgi:hypothetical protein